MTGKGYGRTQDRLSRNRAARLSALPPFDGQPAARQQSWHQADGTTQMSVADSERTFRASPALASIIQIVTAEDQVPG